jgi:hypothetical protein
MEHLDAAIWFDEWGQNKRKASPLIGGWAARAVENAFMVKNVVRAIQPARALPVV